MAINKETYALSKKYTDSVSGGGGGTSDYSKLSNKPSINGVTLLGNKTTHDLKLETTYTVVDGKCIIQ